MMWKMPEFTGFSGDVWCGMVKFWRFFIYVRYVWKIFGVRVKYMIANSWKCGIVISDYLIKKLGRLLLESILFL